MLQVITHLLTCISNFSQCHMLPTSHCPNTSKFNLKRIMSRIEQLATSATIPTRQTNSFSGIGLHSNASYSITINYTVICTWIPLLSRNCLKSGILISPTRTDLCGGAGLERGSNDNMSFSVLPTSASTQAIS